MFTSAAVLGLTDVDAVTVSMARGVAATASPAVVAIAIAVGVPAKAMKLGLAVVFGAPRFRAIAAGSLALMLVAVGGALRLLPSHSDIFQAFYVRPAKPRDQSGVRATAGLGAGVASNPVAPTKIGRSIPDTYTWHDRGLGRAAEPLRLITPAGAVRRHLSLNGTTWTAASGTAPRNLSSAEPRSSNSHRVRAVCPKMTCVTPSR